MPKLNLIGMVVLCLAVAAGAAVMALRTGNGQADTPRYDKLIRSLGDTDPDLRREAERELKQLGPKAEPALKEAARGSDPAVAERARALLGMKKVELPHEGPGSQASVPVSEPAVRLTLQIASSPRRADEPVMYYLRLHNDTKRSLVIARRQRDGRPDYREFGGFERIDAEGRVVELIAALPAPGDDEPSTVEAVVVAPGDSVDLVPGSGLLRVGASGTFRIRYVYDAAEGSEYREWLATVHHAGSALPSERIVSNTAAVTIP
jgi:hypothetical protein